MKCAKFILRWGKLLNLEWFIKNCFLIKEVGFIWEHWKQRPSKTYKWFIEACKCHKVSNKYWHFKYVIINSEYLFIWIHSSMRSLKSHFLINIACLHQRQKQDLHATFREARKWATVNYKYVKLKKVRILN